MNYFDSAQKTVWRGIQNVFSKGSEPMSVRSEPISTAVKEKLSLAALETSGLMFLRLAGISGALAVGLGAYGAHVYLPRPDVPDKVKQVFINANQYHFIHTLALLAIPLTRRPYLVGGLMTLGMSLFCGTCYLYCLGGYESVVKLTPYGGTILIISWLSMAL